MGIRRSGAYAAALCAILAAGCAGDAGPAAVHVAPGAGEVQDGSRGRPFGTIAAAIKSARAALVKVSEGTYRENVTLREGVQLLGGFDASYEHRAPAKYVTRIVPPEGTYEPQFAPLQPLVVMAGHSRLSGFVLDAKHHPTDVAIVRAYQVALCRIDGNVVLNSGARRKGTWSATSGSGISINWSTDVRVVNNTLMNNDGAGIYFGYSQVEVTGNLLLANGWGLYNSNSRYVTRNNNSFGNGVRTVWAETANYHRMTPHATDRCQPPVK